MNYTEFYERTEEIAVERQLTIQAVGTMAIHNQFDFRDSTYGIPSLREPAVAVLSTGEPHPQERRYTVLAAPKREHPPQIQPFIEMAPVQTTPLTARDFADRQRDAAIARSYVRLYAGGGIFRHPLHVAFINGQPDTLAVNGQPTYSHITSQIHTRIFEPYI